MKPRTGGTYVRYDADGIANVDVEATSSTAWRDWLRQLNSAERRDLRIWRGGAIGTPTRRLWRPGSNSDVLCPWCGAQKPSARHMFAECPRFSAIREELQLEYCVQADWWALQPAVTSKTGWITFAAHPCAKTRGLMQVAACRLGVAMVGACERDTR